MSQSIPGLAPSPGLALTGLAASSGSAVPEPAGSCPSASKATLKGNPGAKAYGKGLKTFKSCPPALERRGRPAGKTPSRAPWESLALWEAMTTPDPKIWLKDRRKTLPLRHGQRRATCSCRDLESQGSAKAQQSPAQIGAVAARILQSAGYHELALPDLEKPFSIHPDRRPPPSLF
jgi:hypothetical protein